MASRRLQILEAISLRLQGIQVANGYNTDAGKLVLLGHAGAQLGPNDPDVAVAIVPGEDEVAHQMENILIRWPVGIHALARADLEEPWVSVENVIEDVKKAVELEDRRLGGLVKKDLERGPTTTLEREEGSTSIGASVQYTAMFLEGWGNP